MNSPSANPQLPLFTDRQRDTETRQIAWLESYLLEHPGWHTSRMIQQSLNGLPTDNGDRLIRKLAQLSERIISGQKGYKHLTHATPEEINHFVHWMESQAREMTRRAETIRRNAHRQIG